MANPAEVDDWFVPDEPATAARAPAAPDGADDWIVPDAAPAPEKPGFYAGDQYLGMEQPDRFTHYVAPPPEPVPTAPPPGGVSEYTQMYSDSSLEPSGPPDPSQPMTLTGSMLRGVDIAQGMGYGTIEAIGEATGSDAVARFGKEGRERNLVEAEQYGKRTRLRDIGSVGDAGQWAKETIGEQAPMMAGPMAGGLGGAAAGFAVAGPPGAFIGGILGAFIPSFALGVGEVQGNIKEKDPAAVAPGWAFAGGSAIAALDSVLPGKVGSTLVRRFGAEVAEEIATKSLTRHVAGEVGKGAATEFLTEAVQEAIGEVAGAYGADKPIDWAGLPEQMLEAGAAGALMGGLAGGVSSVGSQAVPAQDASQTPAGVPTGAIPAEAIIPAAEDATQPPPPPPGAAPVLEPVVDAPPQAATPERIVAAAVRNEDGKVYTGQSHVDIVNQPDFVFAGSRDGFVTSSGRFVTREEAAEIAKQSEQVSPDATWRFGNNELHHDDLTSPEQPPAAASAPSAEPAPPPVIMPPAPEPEPVPPSTRPILQAILNDPRPAAEIKAELDARPSGPVIVTYQDGTTASAIVQGYEPDGRPILQLDGGAVIRPKPGMVQIAAQGDGSRAAPVELKTATDVTAGAEQTADPTPAQAEAGNYQKRHVKWRGLDIAIETEAGQERTGIDAGGKPWSAVSPAPYGYIKGTKGRDGDQIDVYIGPDPQSAQVFVIDQIDPDTLKFDEHKVVVGTAAPEQAQAIYEASFSDGTGSMRAGAITPMSVAQFKQWVKNGDHKKALAYAPPKAVTQRAKPKGPYSLFQFLADRGGIRDDGGVLRSMDLHKTFIPGLGRLVRANGRPLDEAREAAVEAGYLQDSPWEGGPATSTVADLLDALDAESRGQKVYAAKDLMEMERRRQETAATESAERETRAQAQVKDYATAEQIAATDDEIARAAQLMLTEGMDAQDALVRVVEESYYAVQDEVVSYETETVDDQAANVATGTDQGGAGLAQASQQPARPAAEDAPERPAGGEQPRETEQPGSEAPAAVAGPEPQPVDAGLENWWQKELTKQGRRQVLAAAGRSAKLVNVSWQHMYNPDRAAIEKVRGSDQDPVIAEPVTKPGATESEKPAETSTKRPEPGKRDFPAYTTQQLKDTLADSTKTRNMRPEVVERMRAEVARRESGESIEAVTPQVGGAGAWKVIGKNPVGQTLYEDQRGVRSYIENGVRISEPVGIVPGGRGITLRRDGDTYKLAEVHPTATATHKVEIEAPKAEASDQKPARVHDQGPHYAAGFGAREKGNPRDLPSYFTDPRNKNAKDWYRGWDAADSEAPKPAREEAPAEPSQQDIADFRAVKLARALLDRLDAGQPITSKIVQDEATKSYGGRLADGKFDRRDMADALELAVNLHIKGTRHLRVDSPDPRHAIRMLGDILETLPTQTVRSEEQVRYQQFSTPPNYSAAAAYAANLRAGDVMLEPSAGTGSLVAAATRTGVTYVVNELSERRAALLRELVGKDGRVFTENAEQIDNILPDDVKPTVVVMNPPFSQTAGRMGDKKVLETGAIHVEQALKRLEPGGRLVAIVGRGMTMGHPRFRAWWDKISKQYAVRANIGVDGKVYEKYGTTFGTRLLVIDKVAPTGEAPVMIEAQTIDDLMRALEPIRDGRPQTSLRPAAEQRPVEQGGVRPTGKSEGGASAPLPPRSESGVVGTPERGGDGVSGIAGADQPSGKPVRVEAGERDGVAPVKPERGGQERAAVEPAEGDRGSGQSQAGSRGGARNDSGQADRGQSGAATSGERVELEHGAPDNQANTSEITESLYEAYEPRRVRVKGAKPHPGPLVQSAAMASVDPPAVTYQPKLPRDVIDKGMLSNAQLESVIYSGHAHQKMLPAADGETAFRRGFFIGDGTGVGKGREVAGIILDNFQQGRTKAIWVSEKRKLLNDAQRDWSGLGQNPAQVFNLGKVKSGEKIQAAKGIGFITYDTLKGGMSDQAAIARGRFVRKQRVSVNGQAGTVQQIIKTKAGALQLGRTRSALMSESVVIKLDNGTEITAPFSEVTSLDGGASVKSRLDQIVDWVGADFDGVIAFDEAHNMGNASAIKDGRGIKEAAQKALAGIDLQRRLPNARIVYVSATGATEVSNLAYAERLGLWGRGTSFASKDKFIADVASGGIAAMELVARDMKQLGLYTARNLSYDGVEYQRIEHKLDDTQREIYDTLADGWQIVLQNIEKALEITGAKDDARAKSAAWSAFWGAHQRFFNQIVTSLQMPSVIAAVEKDLAEGRQAVLQLTNTNEASQERAAAKAESAEEIEDLDITPRDQIIQLIEKSFPTQQYESYVDQDGKERSRPVLDSDGNPVQNREAVAAREALIERLSSIRVPQGPLDMILDHFGIDVVAEVTGRGRRFVKKPDEKTGNVRRVEESRPASANQAETDSFQAGKKRVLVFSEAGGTGASYHADNTAPSKKARRAHYLVQGGWRADKAVQGFGRTHRTNQASAPIMNLVTTDLKGQKRFISSIARRLAQLGALTKGQRQAGDQGIFTARDNLESTEARIALQQFYNDLNAGRVEGITIDEFETQTGLKLRDKDEEGRVTGVLSNLPPITQFLNRLLSLKIEAQNAVFDAFSDRLDTVIEAREAAGVLDVGLETVRADKIGKDSDRVVYTDTESGAETRYVKLTLGHKFVPIDFDDVANNKRRPILFYATSPNGKVYAVVSAPTDTDAKSGTIIDNYRLISPVSESRTVARSHVDKYGTKWGKIDKKEARKLWDEETGKAPEYINRDLHLITGAILPIWDRLKGNPRVVRLQTDAGERMMGRIVPPTEIGATLKALGAEAAQAKIEQQTLYERLLLGARAKLANGWTLKRSLVAGEQRIELLGPSAFSESEQVKKDGVFSERIAYTTRFFVPTGPQEGPKVLTALTQYRPVVELDGAEDSDPAFALSDQPALERSGLGRPKPATYTPQFSAKIERMERSLRAELDRLGLPQVGLRLTNIIKETINGRTYTADAMYHRGVITLALDVNTTSVGERLHHEALHGLRRLGAFTDGEWAILTRAAPAWRNSFKIDKHYDGFPEWAKVEESIAHAYAAWKAGKLALKDGRIARLFKRISDILERIGNALRGHGFKTVEDIFTAVDAGYVGGRLAVQESAPGMVPAYAVRSGDGDLFKTEILQTADGPRDQYVIPGAEGISERERMERQAEGPKKATKPQKSVEALPLFGDSKDQMSLFALVREPETAVERHNVMQGFIARGQPLDRALRMPFDFMGGLTRDGQWKFGQRLHKGAERIITEAEFSPEGRFAWANPLLQTARAGLIDRYGLAQDYVDRERGRALDERAVMLQGAEIIKTLKDHAVGPAEAKVLQAILTGEDVSDAQMAQLAEPIRAAIDQLGQEAVALGLVSPESYERNRGAYLHRVYQKYEADQNGLTKVVNQIMGSRRKKIIGDGLRGRGIFQEIGLTRLMRDVPGWKEAERGRPEIGEKFIRLDEMPNQGVLAIGGEAREPKPVRTIYWPADEAIPDRYSAFKNQGIWEVRGRKGNDITIWRDFSKEERTKMGEIVDARYTIAKTFMLMAHDLSNGRFYKDISENEDWCSTMRPAGKVMDAEEWSAQHRRLATWKRGDVDWVRVPGVEIPNSGGKKRWGALAGKYVREEIWRDLNEIQIMQNPRTWRWLLTQWKLNKTARNPVVHMNNVMSNFLLMDMMDVRMQDFVSGLRSYITKDEHYQDAFAYGAFGGDMMSQEIRDNVLKPILEELQRSQAAAPGPAGRLGQVTHFTEMLWRRLKALDQKMIDAYRIEDEIFRMATYMRRIEFGDEPRRAAETAREQFIDYDIRAPWVNAARNSVLPFISYTYRAVPLVAKAIATRPWKLAKYFMLAYAANALAYALSGGDEDKERRSLREQEQGYTWVGTERMVRLPTNDAYGNPLFLDVRRWIPAGDVFDLGNSDIPPWLNLGGPLMIAAELLFNKSAFFGQEIFNTKTDDFWDRTTKRGDHLWKSLMPSAPWVPGSWYWEKIMLAAGGATDREGRPYSIPGAVSSSIGIKVKPQDVEDARQWQGYEFGKVEQALQTEMRRLAQRRERNIISQSAFDRGMEDILRKLERNAKKRDETLK